MAKRLVSLFLAFVFVLSNVVYADDAYSGESSGWSLKPGSGGSISAWADPAYGVECHTFMIVFMIFGVVLLVVHSADTSTRQYDDYVLDYPLLSDDDLAIAVGRPLTEDAIKRIRRYLPALARGERASVPYD
ncbi:hypothetical protein FACS1894188_07080 [Clostridia bacterium]|nr:hypothetical protein FACS1894188_07080 [Clostridia bacterium]